MASPLNLVEVDTLTLTIIIDNEIDIMSTVSANTVSNKGRMSNLSLSQPNDVSARDDCEKEMPMEAICCGAHGLSILLGLSVDLASIERIQLSHWHRDYSGVMLKAIQMINLAPTTSSKTPVTIELHPSRPTYRGFMAGITPFSMQAESSCPEMEALGAVIETHSEPHTVLDDFFLVSGEIPRVTSYETGVEGGIRFEEETGKWEKDEEIKDERFLVVNLKGKGLILLTGCGYGGVVNSSLNAISLLNNTVPLHAILDSYHLVGEKEANGKDTVRVLKKLNPKVLLPGHCSGWRVKVEIEKEIEGRLVPCSVGARFEF